MAKKKIPATETSEKTTEKKPNRRLVKSTPSPLETKRQRLTEAEGAPRPGIDLDTFCYYYLKTFNKQYSYQAAGGEPNASRNATRYFRRPEVSDRLAVLAVEVLEKLKEDDQALVTNLKQQLVDLTSMVISDIGKMETVTVKDKHGNSRKMQQFVLNDWDTMTRQQKGFIKSVQTKPDGSIKVDTYSRMEAIKVLGEFLHVFKTAGSMNITVNMNFSRTVRKQEL